MRPSANAHAADAGENSAGQDRHLSRRLSCRPMRAEGYGGHGSALRRQGRKVETEKWSTRMGRPVNPIPPGKVHHVPAASRGMESQQHDKAILGEPAKAKGYPLAVHDAMHHVQDGCIQRRVSPRRRAPPRRRATTLPTDPVVQHGSKSLPIPACHPHTRATRRRGVYDPEERPRHDRSSHRRDRRAPIIRPT